MPIYSNPQPLPIKNGSDKRLNLVYESTIHIWTSPVLRAKITNGFRVRLCEDTSVFLGVGLLESTGRFMFVGCHLVIWGE
jgi:hypothetical protein